MTEGLDEEDDERIQSFKRLCYSPPTKGLMSEGWKALADLPEITGKGTFRVDVLQGGIQVGRGWETIDFVFPYDLLARQKAWEKANTGNPARVCGLFRKSATKSTWFEHCVFYKKEGKVYIAFRTDDDTVLEQEVDGPYDITGKEPQLRKEREEECMNVLRGLGYKV